MFNKFIRPDVKIDNHGFDSKYWTGADAEKYKRKLDATLANKNSIMDLKGFKDTKGFEQKGGTYEITLEGGFKAIYEDTDKDGKVSDKDKLQKVMVDGKIIEASWIGGDIKTVFQNRRDYKLAERHLQKLENADKSLEQVNPEDPFRVTNNRMNGNYDYSIGNVLVHIKIDNQGNEFISGISVGKENLATYSNKTRLGLYIKGLNPTERNQFILDCSRELLASKKREDVEQMEKLDAQFDSVEHYAENKNIAQN